MYFIFINCQINETIFFLQNKIENKILWNNKIVIMFFLHEKS